MQHSFPNNQCTIYYYYYLIKKAEKNVNAKIIFKKIIFLIENLLYNGVKKPG
jgi:hypothetical protein